MTIQEFCNKYDITENQYYGKQWINKNLKIDEEELIKGFNPKIIGNLDLKNIKKLYNNFKPIIIGSLDLKDLEEIPYNFEPIITCNFYMTKLKKLPENFKIILGGSLFILGIKELPKIFNIIIKEGDLHILRVKKLPENFSNNISGNKVYYDYNGNSIKTGIINSFKDETITSFLPLSL